MDLQVLDKDFTPLYSLNITYPKANESVDLGNKIKPSEVSSRPDVYIRGNSDDDNSSPTPTTRSNATWALALTDPDATSRSDPTKAEMCHWLVTFNVDTNAVDSVVDVPMGIEAITHGFGTHGLASDNRPTELMSYYPPAPPPKTGYHRYVFVLLAPKSSKEIVADDDAGPKKPKERPHWGYGKVGKGVRDWAKDNGLTPVGANFFYAQNKDQ